MHFRELTTLGLILFGATLITALPTGQKQADTGEKSTVKDDKTGRTLEESSDMLMEPSTSDVYQNAAIIRSPLIYSHHSTSISRSDGFHVPISEYSTGDFLDQSHQQQQSFNQYTANNEDQPAPAAQHFLRSFFRDNHLVSPLGNSRPFFQQAENVQPTRSSRVNAHRSVESGSRGSQNNFDHSILGSGDFGVIRGGTFYQDSDPTFYRGGESSNEFSYYNNKNGHGRPQTAAYVQKYTYPEEQFANFRDFADINTPSDPAYSHFVVVYANKNTTLKESQQQRKKQPKNIFEQLQMLDEENRAEQQKNKEQPEFGKKIVPTKQKPSLSKHKSKLHSTKKEKKYSKHRGPKEEQVFESIPLDGVTEDDQNMEPLLATS